MPLIHFILGIFTSMRGKFIFGILFKWYALVMGVAVIAAYNILKVLHDRGLLDRFFYFVKDLLAEVERISMECPQKVLEIQDLWNCL